MSSKPEAKTGINQTMLDALSGHRGRDQQRIADHGLEWITLILKKNQDYGSSAWKPPFLVPDAYPRDAILVRMSDKIERLRTLYSRNKPGNTAECDESYEDTIRDLGAYCLLYLAAPIGKEESNETPTN